VTLGRVPSGAAGRSTAAVAQAGGHRGPIAGPRVEGSARFRLRGPAELEWGEPAKTTASGLGSEYSNGLIATTAAPPGWLAAARAPELPKTVTDPESWAGILQPSNVWTTASTAGPGLTLVRPRRRTEANRSDDQRTRVPSFVMRSNEYSADPDSGCKSSTGASPCQ